MDDTRYLRWLTIICAGFVLVAAVLFYNTIKLLPFNDKLWQESDRRTRGRMVKNLLENNDFSGFSRGRVMAYLGLPDFDERLYWYHLGPTDPPHKRSARTPVGDSAQFIICFRADMQNEIAEVLLDRRPDSLAAKKFDEEFDEEKWQAATAAGRGKMVKNLLSHHRWTGRPSSDLPGRLGQPDGELFRMHYDVGKAGKLFSFGHALVFVFDSTGHVTEFYLQ